MSSIAFGAVEIAGFARRVPIIEPLAQCRRFVNNIQTSISENEDAYQDPCLYVRSGQRGSGSRPVSLRHPHERRRGDELLPARHLLPGWSLL
jgi:hypothetical protein